MKTKNRKPEFSRRAAVSPAAPKPEPAKRSASQGAPWLAYALAAAGALIVLFVVYSPSLHGAFQFDDTNLPFTTNVTAPFRDWVMGLRPILMASYWLNAQISGEDPYSYHVVNVLIHWFAGGLIFLIVLRLAEWGGIQHAHRVFWAGFAAAVFLLHPVQTEAVAYLAGRSECLSAMFVFAAFAVFVYRREAAASWGTVAAVLTLFGAAVLSKEHTVALLGLLLLTDFWWNPRFSAAGIRRNWKLYVPIALAAAAGVYKFRDLITNASSAGFGMKDFTWYQYFFTECRALFVYPFEFLFPVRLTADWGFPISKTVFAHGAIFGLIALAALAALAWHFRRRFPLAAYGFFVYLVLMAPTSSILPIKDAVAERRLYFSMIGLLLIMVDLLNRVRIDRKQLAAACSVVAALLAIATHARAAVWADPVTLWTDTVAKAPENRRAHFQLAYAQYTAGHSDLAVPEFQRAADIGPVSADLLLDWGLAYDALHRPDLALDKLRQAARMEPMATVYVNIAKIYAERSQWSDAEAALAAAGKLDADNLDVYAFRGKIDLKTGRVCEAIAEYRHALQIDPAFQDALHDLAIAQQMPHDCR